MTVRMLIAKLMVLDGLHCFGIRPENVPISKELLKLAHNAHSSYTAFLEKERLQKEEKNEIATINETKRNRRQ